jgi:hypothetical protein
MKILIVHHQTFRYPVHTHLSPPKPPATFKRLYDHPMTRYRRRDIFSQPWCHMYLLYFIAILQWSIGHPSSASIDGGFWLELLVRQMIFSRIPPKQCASRWLCGVFVIFFLAGRPPDMVSIIRQGPLFPTKKISMPPGVATRTKFSILWWHTWFLRLQPSVLPGRRGGRRRKLTQNWWYLWCP